MRPLRLVIVIGFSLCFGIQFYDLAAKYASKDTTMISNRLHDPNQKLPDIFVCPSPGYKEDVLRSLSDMDNPWQSLVVQNARFEAVGTNESVWKIVPCSSEQVQEWFNASTYSREEILRDARLSEDNVERKVVVTELQSFVFGRCYQLQMEETNPIKSYLHVRLNMPQAVKMFHVYIGDRHGKTKLSLKYNFWSGRFKLIKLTRGIVYKVSFEKSVEEYLPEKIGCKKFPYQDQRGNVFRIWEDCADSLTQSTAEWKAGESTFCYWPITQTMVNKSHPPCLTVGQATTPFRQGRDAIADFDRKCFECTSEIFTTYIQETEKNITHSAFGLFFGDTLTDYKKQYIMNDFNSVVNGIGGSMGLFLGTSFLGIVDLLIIKLENLRKNT